MLSVAEIFRQIPDVKVVLVEHSRYFAHLADGHADKTDELLHEHVELVNQFVERICEAHGLDAVIDRLIEALVATCPCLGGEDDATAIKRRFVCSFLFHDFGKVNPHFQRDKMKKTALFPEAGQVPFFPSSGHSELSTYAYLRYFQPSEASEKEAALFYVAMALAYPIARHHASNLWSIDAFFKGRSRKWVDEADNFNQLIQVIGLDWKNAEVSFFLHFIAAYDLLLRSGEGLFSGASHALYSLVRLNFSLLTAADYLATSVYANGEDYRLHGVFDEGLRAHVSRAIRSSAAYNQDIFAAADDPTFRFENPVHQANNALGRLRLEMGVRVLRQVREQAHGHNLFYIEAPTGGGKTNLSMLATAELLRLKPTLNKVLYVFPFTTLVTQTYQSISKAYQLPDYALTQLHSKAGYKDLAAATEVDEEADAKYGREKRDYLTNLFNHFPVTLCTHVRLAEWMTSPGKETNYAFHRLANSIVVIDELQAYNPAHWAKLIYFFDHFAKYFNTHFIIMSATLPKIDKLLPRLGLSSQAVAVLLPDAKRLYFNNPNFKGRVSFDTSLLGREMDISTLAQHVTTTAQQYALGNTLHPGSVYCMVECIFKKSATELYAAILKMPPFFDHVWVLSGTILEHRRRTIINQLKNPDFRKLKILLITTQVVEAGVDIDMDLGYKDRSILDSDEQLAGRINRNVNKPVCKLYLFRKDRASILYEKDLRFDVSRAIAAGELKRILEEKDFDTLYEKVFEAIERDNHSTLKANLGSYIHYFCRLDFPAIHKEFKLIDANNLSIFVPIDVPLRVPGELTDKEDCLFSEEDIAFLKHFQVACQTYVSGEAVFDLYLKMVRKELDEADFIAAKTAFIRLRGIMSKFVFSMFSSEKLLQKLTHYLDKEKSEYGFVYLSRYRDIYDEEAGLQEAKFEDLDNQFF